jgi:hypothetical protein
MEFLLLNAKDLAKKLGLDLKNHVCTPMSTSVKLSVDPSGIGVDQTLFCSMIGSLMYLTMSHPDIYFSNPKESHLATAKHIIRYVNGTMDHGIWYSQDTNLNLAGYSNAELGREC